MTPEETIQAHLDVKGKMMVPIHWGMFTLALHHWSEPVERTSKLAQEKDIHYIAPKLGEIIQLGEDKKWEPWW